MHSEPIKVDNYRLIVAGASWTFSTSIRRKMKRIMQAASNDKANLETLMNKELDKLSPMSPSRCIFRVPDRLRRVRKEDYTPRVISIGPLHHGKEALKAMEEHKKRYLQYFLRRRRQTNNLVQNFQHNLSLKDCIKKIQDKEPELRSQYSETIDLESDEFVRIILVDAIFIIEFLFRCSLSAEEKANENDCIFGVPRMARDIWLDLMMLENQLPFFILKDLFDQLNGVDERHLLGLSCNFLDGGSSTFGGMSNNLDKINSSEVKHFVDLLRKLCIAPILNEQSEGQSTPTAGNQSLCISFRLCPKKEEKPHKDTTTPSITKLHLAGVKFKVRSTNNLFGIKFANGILEIPELKTGDFTELILRNLIAFEQCTFDKCYISDYVSIMDEFLDTPKDVELLVKYGIVENILGGGDEELSTMINSLSTGVIYGCDFYYGTLCEKLNEFCSSKCNKRIANLRQKYFNTPWSTISFFAAVILLMLTVIQTFCSVMSLPNNKT